MGSLQHYLKTMQAVLTTLRNLFHYPIAALILKLIDGFLFDIKIISYKLLSLKLTTYFATINFRKERSTET